MISDLMSLFYHSPDQVGMLLDKLAGEEKCTGQLMIRQNLQNFQSIRIIRTGIKGKRDFFPVDIAPQDRPPEYFHFRVMVGNVQGLLIGNIIGRIQYHHF